MITTLLAVGAATWGVFMALSPLLQIRRIMRRRSSSEISLGYFYVLIVGFCLWIAYGLSIGNPALVVPNAVALIVAVATVTVAVRYRTARRRAA